MVPVIARGDLGQARVGPAIEGKALLQHDDPVGSPIPGSNQLGAGLDPPRQLKPAVWLGLSGLDQLGQEAPMLLREAAVGLLLNPICDAAP